MQPERLESLSVDWPAPPGVGAFMSTREGGVSVGPFARLNLGDHVGDSPVHVAQNRHRFERAIGARPVWMHQVHEARVVDAASAAADEAPTADGAWTTTPGVACVVLVADCLPVLLAARNGRAVGAAHAGWRGLALGVVAHAVDAVSRAAECEPAELVAWLGPGIGPQRFEVGTEVLEAFGQAAMGRFTKSTPRDGRPRWLADLPGLARDQLRRSGLEAISGGRWCTVNDASRFFSFRRDGVTGRMAGAVWLRP